MTRIKVKYKKDGKATGVPLKAVSLPRRLKSKEPMNHVIVEKITVK